MKIRGLWVGLCFLWVSLCPVLSFSSYAFEIHQQTLQNGMQVYVVPMHRAPVVTHFVGYKVGAIDEELGKSGLAHFLEHLMFKGTATVKPGEFSKVVAETGGRDNAMTSWDYTGYYQSVAKEHLEKVMVMEADRMVNLVLEDSVVLPERDVIIEERRSQVENKPERVLYEQAMAALYQNVRYGIPIIGWKHEMAKLTTQDALDFYQKWYAPNNAFLIVCGDVDPASVFKMAEKTYGSLKSKNLSPRLLVDEPQQLAERRLTLYHPATTVPTVAVLYLAPPYQSQNPQESFALTLLATHLGGSSISVLYESLVVDQKLAVDVGAYYSPSHLMDTDFVIEAKPAEGISLEQLEKAIHVELDKFLSQGVRDDDLQRIKYATKASYIFALESPQSMAFYLNSELSRGRSVEDILKWQERLQQVTSSQILDAAKMVFNIKQSVTSYLYPENKP